MDGQPITAAHLRELLTPLDAVCPGGLRAPPGGTLTLAITDRTGALRATPRPAGGRADRPLRLPQAPGRRRHRHRLRVSGAAPAAAAQRLRIRTRDRTCRHPGCANAAGWADLDHVLPHACGGPTAWENPCCLCRRPHRLKTHAPGWIYAMTADGVLAVTTPSGVTRSTRPPGQTPPDLHLLGPRVLAEPPPEPPPTPDPADDPPPF